MRTSAQVKQEIEATKQAVIDRQNEIKKLELGLHELWQEFHEAELVENRQKKLTPVQREILQMVARGDILVQESIMSYRYSEKKRYMLNGQHYARKGLERILDYLTFDVKYLVQGSVKSGTVFLITEAGRAVLEDK